MDSISSQDLRAPQLLLLLLLAGLVPLATPSVCGAESGVCLPAAELPGSRLLRCHSIRQLRHLGDRALKLRGTAAGALVLRGGEGDDDFFDPLGPEDEVDREALRMLAGDARREGESARADEAMVDEGLEESQSNRRFIPRHCPGRGCQMSVRPQGSGFQKSDAPSLALPKGRIFIELMTSYCKVKASREGSK
jgi:hypothetical protein